MIEIEYDQNKVEYENLVKYFYRMHDPTTLNRQGNDKGMICVISDPFHEKVRSTVLSSSTMTKTKRKLPKKLPRKCRNLSISKV